MTEDVAQHGSTRADGTVASRFDPDTPHPARIYNYWLGGKDHFRADRRAAEAGHRVAAHGGPRCPSRPVRGSGTYMTDDPEMWASILGWHCWRGAAGIWYARQVAASPATVLRAASLDALRTLIDNGFTPGTGASVRPESSPATLDI